MLKVLLISIILIAIAFLGIAIKMLFKKGAQFEKHCSSVDPGTGKQMACGCGTGEGGAECRNNPQESVH